MPFQAFNSRTCQVVLGAGAMRSAGLKNITARHLGMAFTLRRVRFELTEDPRSVGLSVLIHHDCADPVHTGELSSASQS